MAGALSGLRVIEIAGIGPGPFCAMMLADHGAEVIRVERRGAHIDLRDPLLRSRRIIQLDLKSEDGLAEVRGLINSADALIEGFRPGVMERLGLGPDRLLADNPKLVYGRMTGWGQYGPLAHAAGHDINYIALSGALHAFGRADQPPTPPLNLVGDFGGGAMMLAFGIVAALLNVARGGEGQVIDCAMTDGSALLMASFFGWFGSDKWRDERGVNTLDTGADFYDSFRCADGKFVAIGSLEPQFYALLREKLGLVDDPDFDQQRDRARWPERRKKLAAIFATESRDHWCTLMEGSDVCFAPVLSLSEAPTHPHNVARESFVYLDGIIQPAPAPRLSGTPAELPRRATVDASTTEAGRKLADTIP